jgi:hypothetical protein
MMVGEVMEESSAEPDVRLALPNGDVVWIEATHVSPRNQKLLDEVQSFPDWIRKELNSVGVDTRRQHIQLNARKSGDQTQMTVPPGNVRRGLKGKPEWRRFVRDIVDTRKGVWLPGSEFNVIVVVSPGSGYTSGAPVVGIPRQPDDHVVYRAIESKAEQIKRRSNRLEQQPLILSVCASHPDAQIDPTDIGAIPLKQAIVAAVADTSGWSTIALRNGLGPGHRKGLQVSGAELVSAVLITDLRAQMEGWRPQFYTRHARSRLFLNPGARCKLTASALEQLRELHFNHYRYGPQWGEHWRDPLDRTDGQDERRERDPGAVTIGFGANSVKTVEITTSMLLRLLSGRTTPEEAFSSFGEDTWPSLQAAFSEGREIVGIEVLPGDPAVRRTQRVKITFGDPIPPVLSVRKETSAKPEPRRGGA